MRRLTLVAALALASCASATASQDAIDPDAIIVDGAPSLDVTGGDLHATLPDLDPEGTHLVYCRSGSRAGAAIGLMKQAGFIDIRILGSLEDTAVATGLPVIQPGKRTCLPP